MKTIYLAIAAAALVSTASVRAQEFEYQFVSDPFVPFGQPGANPTDGSAISQWGGELFLDSSSSATAPHGGTLADVDLADSFFYSPNDGGAKIYLDDPDIVNGGNSGPRVTGSFVWDSTGIITMNINGFANDPDVGFTLSASFINVTHPEPQDNGAWVAAPDAGSTGMLIGLAVAGLFGFEYFGRNRRLALAK